jgi:anti-anti-sigma factor
MTDAAPACPAYPPGGMANPGMIDNLNLATFLSGNALVASFKCSKIGDFECGPLKADIESVAPLAGWRIVADLSKVALLGSSGIGMLVRLKKTCDEHKGRLVLCGLSEELEGVLRISALLKMFVIKKTVADAVASL